MDLEAILTSAYLKNTGSNRGDIIDLQTPILYGTDLADLFRNISTTSIKRTIHKVSAFILIDATVVFLANNLGKQSRQ